MSADGLFLVAEVDGAVVGTFEVVDMGKRLIKG